MKFNLLVAVFMLLSCFSHAQETLLFQESFEDTNAVFSYIPDRFYDTKNDYFHVSNRGDRTNTTAEYTGQDLYYFWMAEDLDNNNRSPVANITFPVVKTEGYKNLYAKVLVAAGNESAPYDKSDSLVFYCSTDGGLNFRRVLKFAFENNGDAFNEIIRQDTDFDGNGDGSILTTVFQEFTFNLPVADSIIIRTAFTLNADAEELAIDNLRIYGTDILTSTQTNNSTSILISPNPFSDKLNVSSNQELIITDLMGNVFFEGKAENGSVDTHSYSKGVYILRFKNQVEVFKLIKN